MEGLAGDTPGPPLVRRALRLALGTAFFVLAGFIGRATIIDGATLSLIWPAAGVAGLWIGSGNRRTWPGDVTALALATYVVNTLTGAAFALASVLVVTNVIQVCVFVLLIRTWVPTLWAFGGDQALARVVDLGRLASAAILACLLGALLGAVGLQLVVGEVAPASFMVWWGRNSVALIVITTLGVLLGHPIATAGHGRRWGVVRDALTPATPGRLLEALGLTCASLLLYLELFLDNTGRPLAFLALVMSVWAGLRFAPLAVTVHGIAMGVTGIAFTLAGKGPFAAIASLSYQALVSQVFVAMTVLTGLALAFSRAERDQANRELVAARRGADERAQLLDAVLESMNEGIVVLEEGGRILVRNSNGRRLLGLEETDAETMDPVAEYALFHPNGLPVLEHELPGIRALTGRVVAGEDFHVRAAAVPQGRVVEISAHPLHNDDTEAPARSLVNIRDVTVDRQHRDALASFAGVVAHDLFNPLSLVQGWTETLDDEFGAGPVSPAVGLPMVARIHDAAAHMRDFIGDLMAYTVARDQSLRTGAVDLTTVIRQLAGLRSGGGNSPVIQVDDGLTAWADEGLVRQLFDNLLGNAVKYVAPGVQPRVAVTGRVIGFHVEIRVTDNGIGIPAAEREQIFESFHRAHAGYHGTGLGLAICHRIVDRHGGTIRAESGPGHLGSSFVLTLPVAPSAVWHRVTENAGGVS